MSLRVYHSWRDLAPEAKGAAVAFGNFDGVHVGHQHVIADAADAAYRLGAPIGVVSLEPHPLALFNPGGPPFRLTNPHQLARAVEAAGAERLYLLPFGHEMANLSDRDFVEQILVGGLGVRHVAVGFDVTYGKNRSGDPAAMQRYGEACGFSVSVAPEVDADDGSKISSTAIREAIRAGDPAHAARLLGRPFAIEGLVQKGQQLGRKLGIPTANVPLGEYVVPKLGVYATLTTLKDGRRLPGVANIGVNPTTGEVEPRLEVWLFDFDEDIYGETIETALIAFIRPEEKFASVEAMLKVIADDAAKAREILKD
ncbi:MAG TPA: bifunctional riboflavin kinase/FAD synthetase [Caulobacteraceae bacterium]|nr:bifunctional riboflavin kinase/FAD synthetase [Caulobacteraceae bacterium]